MVAQEIKANATAQEFESLREDWNGGMANTALRGTSDRVLFEMR